METFLPTASEQFNVTAAIAGLILPASEMAMQVDLVMMKTGSAMSATSKIL